MPPFSIYADMPCLAAVYLYRSVQIIQQPALYICEPVLILLVSTIITGFPVFTASSGAIYRPLSAMENNTQAMMMTTEFFILFFLRKYSSAFYTTVFYLSFICKTILYNR